MFFYGQLWKWFYDTDGNGLWTMIDMVLNESRCVTLSKLGQQAELTLFLTFPGAVVDRVCFGGNFVDTDPDDVAGRTIDVVIVV